MIMIKKIKKNDKFFSKFIIKIFFLIMHRYLLTNIDYNDSSRKIIYLTDHNLKDIYLNIICFYITYIEELADNFLEEAFAQDDTNDTDKVFEYFRKYYKGNVNINTFQEHDVWVEVLQYILGWLNYNDNVIEKANVKESLIHSFYQNKTEEELKTLIEQFDDKTIDYHEDHDILVMYNELKDESLTL